MSDRRAGVPLEYTPEQIEEFVKCTEDPYHFISHYVKIVSLDLGLVQFNPFEYQKLILDTVLGNRFTIVKLPRQAGKTTIMSAVMLWYAMFNADYKIGVVAHKADQAIEIVGRIKKAYENLPDFLKQGIAKWNEGSVRFENGSEIISSATTKSSLRGLSLNMVYMDEFAIVEANIQEEFMKSVYPVVTAGTTTKIIITSTPRGLNYFYKIWRDSEEGKNSYKRIEINWWDTPGRDEKWKKETIENTSEEQFRQEFECEFLGSSNTLIYGPKLAQLTYSTPIFISADTKLKVFKMPQKDHIYVMTVDTARGVNQDNSAFCVFDVSIIPHEVVATFKDNKVDPMIYPSIIKQVAHDFNDACVLVESNDIGTQVVSILVFDLEYEWVFRTSPKGRSGIRLTDVGDPVSTLGMRTTAATKRIGCLNLKTIIEKDKLFVSDFDIINELQQFVQKGSSYEAEQGHDDLVMCLVLFAWMVNQDQFKEITNLDMRRNLLGELEKRIEENVLPFGFSQDNQWEDPNEIKTMAGDAFDRWLME